MPDAPTTPTPADQPAAPTPTPVPTPPADPPNPAASSAATADDGKDWKAEAEKWKDLARKHERRQLEALGFDPEQVEKFKADPSSVAKKATGYDELLERIAGIEKDRDEAKQQALKATVASAKGVPAELLAGSTQAELEAAADRLLAFKTATAPPRSATPQEAGAGKQGMDVGAPKQLTREDLAKLSPEDRLKAAKDGQLRDLLKA